MEQHLAGMVMAIIRSLEHNWIPLTLAILTAAILKAYVDAEWLKQALVKKSNISIWASVGLGAFTPFCACGTTAVIIGMLTTTLPWGPVMAFLTSSPLMSPEGFILLAGVISLKFAMALTAASIALGLSSGYLTHWIERKTEYLKDQTRFADKPKASSCGCSEKTVSTTSCNCSTFIDDSKRQSACITDCGQKVPQNTNHRWLSWLKWRAIGEGLFNLGLKQILPNFVLFVAIGYFVNTFVPTDVIVTFFSAKNIFAVPLAALIGLPLYVTTESSIPLIQSLMAGGAGGGAMMAFMITGPATSAWVIAGISTFMKKRVIGLYIGLVLGGAILLGYVYDMLLVLGI